MAESDNTRVVAIAIDGSAYAEQAFDWYMENIRRENDSLVLIHVPESYDLHLASPGVVQQILEELEVKVKAIEDKYKAKVDGKIQGKFRTGSGKPGEVIVKIADEEKAGMIVTGTRGQGKFRRTVMGSVSDYIVHHAHVPVLVCRKEKDLKA
ncbi:universal stress protein in QAH/OAS sulfhydrylase 3'region-like [Ylistrum balloti]|uniref:universal stress protein in QAH/OAS sulfhydrylase 3'region-like n=1 Tax=Ylistrum balloti TaxID=509963 RepID=UPI002905F572|nr:universal stress protein in QAH/OAS sulfhydrylase 3'region-like [Ylistrum balloti]